MRSCFYCTTMYRLVRTLKRHCHGLTDQPIERPGCGSVFSASGGGGQRQPFRHRRKSGPHPHRQRCILVWKDWRATSMTSNTRIPPDSSRLIWKCCGSGWELICPWAADINLDRTGILKCLTLFVQSKIRAQPEMVADWPPRRGHVLCQISVLLHGAGKMCLDAHTRLRQV